MTSPKDAAMHAAVIADLIKPMLAGQGAGVVGAVLLELVSIWVAGHNPSAREEIYKQWSDTMLTLVPIQEAEIFKRRPKPPGWV